MISFKVYGEPVAQGRPRSGKTRTGNVVMYDPGKSKDYKQYVRMVASQHKPPKLIDTAVILNAMIYRPIPHSWSKKKQEKARNGEIRPTSKPDLSNYLKGIEDALEGILLANDSVIVGYGDSGKWYSDEPRIEITIEEVTA